jgi:hypothetical protein
MSADMGRRANTALFGLSCRPMTYDNSANNKYNPDPLQVIGWGQQNWDEMQECYVGFLMDPRLKNPATLFKLSGPSLLPRSTTTSGPALSSLVVTNAK